MLRLLACMMPDLLARSQARNAATGRLSTSPPLRILLSWTTIAVNTNVVTNVVAHGPVPEPAVRWGDRAMNGTPSAKGRAKIPVNTRAMPFRSAAPTRRGLRPPIALGALNGHLGYFVRRLQVWVFQDFIRTLARIDISPAQFSVLVVISANRGLSQAELAETLGIERARLVRLLHRLEARGLIQRLQSAADGRRHALQLAARGRTLLASAKTLASHHEKRLIEKLGPERHSMLLQALRGF
jgi:DNA-binding MarR family transcriptional regulator